MSAILNQRTEELKAVLDVLPEACGKAAEQAAKLIIEAYRNGGGVFLFGNGGSAADAQHIAGELNGRFLKERRPLKAQALVGDAATVTSIANDYGYEQIFAKQLEANATQGDIAFGLSTSGNSPNVLEAFAAAKNIGMKTIAMTGQGGGQCAELADVLIAIPSDFTPHVQEAGTLVYHCLCEQIESVFCAPRVKQ
jgi:D-sedoheptulose 7-phosphate isomerase